MEEKSYVGRLTGKTTLRKFTKISFVVITLWCAIVILVNYVDLLLRYKQIHVTVDILNRSYPAWQDRWQPVTRNVSIYSAFHDTRENRSLIRVVGMGPKSETVLSQIQCVIEVNSSEIELRTEHQVLPEHHHKKYVAVYFSCYLDGHKVPRMVGLRTRVQSATWIRVHEDVNKRSYNQTSRKKMAICVRPVYGDDNMTFQVAEFLAVWGYLGASRFYFYNYKMPNEFLYFLETLSKQGQINIEVMSWNLLAPEGLSWSEGQLAFLQDCLHRSMRDHEFVIPVDLDEFIVPNQSVSLLQFMERGYSPNVASYLIHHALYCLVNQTGLLTQNVLKRHTSLGGFRSKCIHIGRKLDIMGIHHPWSRLGDAPIASLPPEMVLLRHYRANLRKFNYSECTVEDDSALRMSEVLKKSPILTTYDTVHSLYTSRTKFRSVV